MRILEKVGKLRVAAVSYLNTIPFVYGLDHSDISEEIDLKLGNPRICAQLLENNQVDIALIPTGALMQIGKVNVISPYCLAADGEVGSVFLLSNTPINSINEIYTDSHSITSNLLSKILCLEHWKIHPEFTIPNEYPPVHLSVGKALVAIGDKAFKMHKQYKYAYDLAAEWKKMTGLPFVFAVWASKKNLHSKTKLQFNKALQGGVNNIQACISYNRPVVLQIDDIHDYLTNKIKFVMNDSIRQGLELYLDKIWPDRVQMVSFE